MVMKNVLTPSSMPWMRSVRPGTAMPSGVPEGVPRIDNFWQNASAAVAFLLNMAVRAASSAGSQNDATEAAIGALYTAENGS